MRIRLHTLGLAVAIVATAVPAWADSITVLAITRSITANATAGSTSTSGGVSNRTFLDKTVMASSGDDFASVGAGLDTTDTVGTEFVALGGTFVMGSSAAAGVGGTALSTFAVQFLVNESVRFIFGATFAAFGGDSSWLGALRSDAGDVFRYEGSDSLGPLANGVLAPGRYEFVVRAQSSVTPRTGSVNTGANFNVGLGFEAAPSATPEPGSLLLLGTGVAGLVARRRRRRPPA